MTEMSQFPHCDSKVLHAPGLCTYCDQYPDWQQLRVTWGMNFTGTYVEGFTLCPSQQDRSIDIIQRWGGNRPVGMTPVGQEPDLAPPLGGFNEEPRRPWWSQ